MPKRITDAMLRRSRPSAKKDVSDALQPGLIVRLQPSGRHSFRLRPRIGKSQRSITLGTFPQLGIAEAREAAREHQQRLATGQHSAQTGEPEGLTVQQLYDRWMDGHVRTNCKRGTRVRYEGSFERRVLPFIGDLDAGTLDRSTVRNLVYGTAEEAPVEANRTLAAIRAAFNWAFDMDLVDHNPADRIRKPYVEKPRERTLSDDEIARAWHAYEHDGSPAARAFQLTLLALPRIKSILPLHQDEIREAGSGDPSPWAVIPGERMKSGKPHAMPLTTLALEILGTPDPDGYFFRSRRGSGPITTYANAMARLKRLSGIPDLGPHLLRKTAATKLAELGVPEHVISLLLAHQPRTVTGRHYQLYRYDRERREALELWGRRVAELAAL